MSISGKRNQAKINALDIFVIFLVLCLVFTLAYKIYKGAAVSKESKNSSYIMTFDCDISIDSIERYVKDGDAVYMSSSGEFLGYIIKQNDGRYALYEKNSRPGEMESEETDTLPETIYNNELTGEDNTYGASNIQDNYGPGVDNMNENESIYTIVKLSGSISLNGNIKKSANGNYYVLGSDNLTVGGRLTVYTDNAEFVITITEIDEKKE